MLPLKFTYLFGSLLFLLLWIFIYLKRKDLRTPLLLTSTLVMIFGLVPEYLWWTKDWWHPQTLLGYRIGIEDLILGFGSGGVAATLYFFIFNKPYPVKIKPHPVYTICLFSLIFTGFGLFAALFYFAKVNSFYSTLISMFLVTTALLFEKRNFILISLTNGLLMVILVITVFILMQLLTPGFITNTWVTNNLFGIYLIGIPIEDCIFYFLTGVLVFLLYPFSTGLEKFPNKR